VALVAVSPLRARDDDELFQTDEYAVLAFAAAHLPVGASQVGEIKERTSRTAGETYLSNGCFHCDALLGNFFLFNEELSRSSSPKGIEAFGCWPQSASRWPSGKRLGPHQSAEIATSMC
jgi:hypothetical protein